MSASRLPPNHKLPLTPPDQPSGLPKAVLTASLDLGALRGELDEDDVAEGLLGVVGDADGRDLGVGVVLDPLVVLGVADCISRARSAEQAAVVVIPEGAKVSRRVRRRIAGAVSSTPEAVRTPRDRGPEGGSGTMRVMRR